MLFEDIQKENIEALKAHDKTKRAILTLVYGKFKLESINKGLNAKSLDDADCIIIIRKTIKELDEEYEGYKKGGREESANEVLEQKKILEAYLPTMISEEKIREEIEKLEDKKIPNVMKFFKANYNGVVDMALVSKIAKEYN